MTKTEANLISRAIFQRDHVSGEGWVFLLTKREVSAGRSLVKHGLAEWRDGRNDGSPSDHFDAIRWYRS